MPEFITSDRVTIHYHDYGGQLKPAVILLTGYSSSEVTWYYQIEPLLAADYRVITYDHRSHGHSSQVTYGLTAARLAVDLHELMNVLDLEAVTLVGHSMGAVIAMTYETLFTDQRLRAVITEDQTPTILRKANWLDGQTGLAFAEIPHFMQRLPQLHLMAHPLSQTMKLAMQPYNMPFNFQLGQTLLLDTIAVDWRTTLSQEHVPHLFIAGAKSPLYPAEHASAARQLQKNGLSAVKIIQDVGHIPHLENVDLFNTTLLNFLAKL